MHVPNYNRIDARDWSLLAALNPLGRVMFYLKGAAFAGSAAAVRSIAGRVVIGAAILLPMLRMQANRLSEGRRFLGNRVAIFIVARLGR